MLESPVRRISDDPRSAISIEPSRPEVPLSALGTGESGTVIRIDTSDPRRLHKLLALGVLPGCAIELRHRYPSFVFGLGHTEFAVDGEMASAIFVRKDSES